MITAREEGWDAGREEGREEGWDAGREEEWAWVLELMKQGLSATEIERQRAGR
jgi:predicted transposase YdaD